MVFSGDLLPFGSGSGSVPGWESGSSSSSSSVPLKLIVSDFEGPGSWSLDGWGGQTLSLRRSARESTLEA